MFATQEQKRNKTRYGFVVLCDKDENSKFPFSYHARSNFSEKEILDRWINSILDDSSRLKTLHTLENVQDKQFSLFGKIPEGVNKTNLMYCKFFFIKILLLYFIIGVSTDDIEATLNSLNKYYHGMREGGETQTSSLIAVASKFPYRFNCTQKVTHHSLI